MTALQIGWEHDPAMASPLAEFFVGQIDPTYISFGEMQEGRAVSAQEWSPDLHGRVVAELKAALGAIPGLPVRRVAVAREHDVLAGFAVVAFHRDAPHPYAVLEDLVVDRARRGVGIGRALVHFVLAACPQMECPRVFLESGHRNHEAHSFFAQLGFHPVSMVFVRDL